MAVMIEGRDIAQALRQTESGRSVVGEFGVLGIVGI